jgi:hypothetical protein
MVMGSALWMEGSGLGLVCDIVQRYVLETGSEQGFGIGEKVAHLSYPFISNNSQNFVSNAKRLTFDMSGRPIDSEAGSWASARRRG